jgi:hypothetical protein
MDAECEKAVKPNDFQTFREAIFYQYWRGFMMLFLSLWVKVSPHPYKWPIILIPKQCGTFPIFRLKNNIMKPLQY